MKKVLFQGVISVVLFFSIWFVLNQIDWMNLLRVQKATDYTEEQIGTIFSKIYKNESIDNQFVINSVDSVLVRICTKNKIDREKIQMHVVTSDDVNAFALPGHNLVVNKGLLLACDNQEELAGVLGHEIAHIELNHVMQKVIKEIGLSVLISITTGERGPEGIQEIAKQISSTAFDRSLEEAADIMAVDYLITANIDPEPFAEFLYKLSDRDHEITKYLSWVSTHPDSKDRSIYIIEESKKREIKSESILSNSTWNKLQHRLHEISKKAHSN